MSRVLFHSVPPQAHAQRFARTWTVSLGLWGAGAGVTALYLLSVTPLVKREFLTKVPVLGDYFTDKTPASDKPF
ncbi:ubiquinol-cytochrome-c reductase complex subunit-domain-containing protein [Lenzites betulinus]|nr:ubiquinol-cytochrome-c reductase complex subunit-domain-containing protein [Lenzites betulinus]